VKMNVTEPENDPTRDGATSAHDLTPDALADRFLVRAATYVRRAGSLTGAMPDVLPLLQRYGRMIDARRVGHA